MAVKRGHGIRRQKHYAENLLSLRQVRMMSLEEQYNFLEEELSHYRFANIPILLEKGDIDINFDHGRLLKLGSEYDDLQLVQYLLTCPQLKEKAIVDVSSIDSPETALTLACLHNSLLVVQFLLSSPFLESKANVHINGESPWYAAWTEYSWDVISYLLTLTGEQAISFQNTRYNLQYALNVAPPQIVESMMINLKREDPITYYNVLPDFYHYCVSLGFLSIYEKVVALEPPILTTNNTETILLV